MTGDALTAAPAVAPPAPGRIGEPVDPQAALTYLTDLGRWRDQRRAELDQLDQAALSIPARAGAPTAPSAPGAVTGDIMLSLALWKAVSDRYEQLRSVWDSGRIGLPERERLSTLIWARLDTSLDPTLVGRSSVPGSSALAVSLPEACRLSDALASQLRVRLGLETSGAEVTERLRQLRAQMERIRDQIDLEPAGAGQAEAAATQARLARRLKEMADKAARGGDVGGLLEPLEIAASTFERDLIVNGARRREAADLVRQAREIRADLEIREAELRALVEECVATVTPAPHYAVPDVAALGPVPNTADRLPGYLARLQQVSRAMTVLQTAYERALAEHAELVSRLDGYHAKAVALGVAERPEVAQAYGLAHRALHSRPCEMVLAAQLVPLYQTYVQLEKP